MFTNLLNNNFSIRRPNRTGDGEGGFITDYPVIATIRGRLSQNSGGDMVISEKWDGTISHVLFTNFGVDIKRRDFVEFRGVVYRVITVREPSHMRNHLEIDLEEIQEVAPWLN